jgi:hypothetical protein
VSLEVPITALVAFVSAAEAFSSAYFLAPAIVVSLDLAVEATPSRAVLSAASAEFAWLFAFASAVAAAPLGS